MIISSWNVNSIKVRLPNVLQYLAEYEPDILVLQETKSIDLNFPEDEIQSCGYHSYYCGQKTYNGVAILSKGKCLDVELNPVAIDEAEVRTISCTYNNLRVLNVYVVNGKSVGSDKYQHKLKWLKKLNNYCKSSLTEFKNFVVLGDFNIAPTDNDVFDIESTKDQILCSVDERKSFNNLLKLGLYDLFDKFDFSPQTFTWWDYRAGAFHRNIGYRIDHILGSKSVLDGCKSFIIDKETRHKSWCKKEPRTSDHAPVRVELSL